MRSRSRLLMFIFTITLLIVPAVVLADPLDITETDRDINPDEVEVGDAATVTLSVAGNACEGTTAGVDVALVMDRSWSMYDTCNASGCPNPTEDRIGPAVNAAKAFVDRLSANDQGAVVAFAGFGEVRSELGSSPTDLKTTLDGLINDPADTSSDGGTAIGRGISSATTELQSSRHDPNNATAMIVLSDGGETENSDPVGQADIACKADIQVFTIGLGSEVDESMEKIPCNGGFYREAPTPADLDAIYQSIADTVLGPISTDTTITEKVPAGLTASSISDNGVLSGDTITWSLAEVRNNRSVSYQVVANQTGTYTFDSGSGIYENCAGTPDQPFEFPDDNLVVVDTSPATPSPATPTPSPATPTPEPSSSPPEPIPEPATIILLGGGAAMLGAYLRRRGGEGEEE